MHFDPRMMSTSVTSQQLEGLLGEIDPLIIDRIVDTHASLADVTEALAEVEEERESGRRRLPTSERVAAVRDILTDVLEGDDDDVVTRGYD